MKHLQQSIAEGSFVLDLKAGDAESIVHQTLNHVVARRKLPAELREEVEQALLERERTTSTAIGHAVAVPHVYHDAFEKPLVVFVRLARPVNLGAPDGINTHFVFMLLGPPAAAGEHIDTLAAIARLMSDDEFRYEAGRAKNGDELRAALARFVQRTSPQQRRAPHEFSEALQYTGRPFGGIALDLKRRLPHYLSDIRDGFSTKTISSTLFLYFACLAPAITFGGIMAAETGAQMGAVEMLLASAICGCIYAIFSGQPLIILGGTGPLLIFTAILYEICDGLGLPFLETYAWVGLWTGIFVVLLGIFDLSWLMRFFTRFTDETFAALISMIFIMEAIKKTAEIYFEENQANDTAHDTVLLSIVLALGTFYLAMSLSRFRRSRYLFPLIREFLADFGPAIAIVVMTLLSLLFYDVDMSEYRLQVPESFRPTADAADAGDASRPRAWLLNFTRAPVWVWFAAMIPAALAAVLVYVDQNITARLVNSPDHRLVKGEAYHLDLTLVGLLIAGCSMFGLPWLVAATVRSLNHVRSLADTESVQLPGGQSKERIIHVREQRLSPLAIHALIGVSIPLLFVIPANLMIPLPVLYGLFLFMGVVSMSGNQFFERLSLWIMDRHSYPSTHYIRKVRKSTIHKFTLVQAGGLLLLLIVDLTPVRILFPLFLAMLVPLRFSLGRFFKKEDLAALDAEEEPKEEEEVWV